MLGDRAELHVFEKSRGYGGRMATRYTERFQFDFGAQYFTVKDEGFRRFLQPYIDDGTLQRWDALFAEIRDAEVTGNRNWADGPAHYVPAPKMTALACRLAEGLEVRRGTRVSSLARSGFGWQLLDDGGNQLGSFDWVIITAPAEQTGQLLVGHPSIGDAVSERRMQACFALMIGLDTDPGLPWQAALVHDSPVSWISVDSSKPGRQSDCSLVVQSANAWADQHFDDPLGRVRKLLLDAASRACGLDLHSAAHVDLHRWRYANIPRQDGEAYLLDADARLAACGDWMVQGRVEGAFCSAAGLASALGGLL